MIAKAMTLAEILLAQKTAQAMAAAEKHVAQEEMLADGCNWEAACQRFAAASNWVEQCRSWPGARRYLKARNLA